MLRASLAGPSEALEFGSVFVDLARELCLAVKLGS